MALKDILADTLTEKELEKAPSSFDLLGNKERAVAIVEVPEELDGKKIAKAIMEQHKNVVSVLAKKSKRKGKYRIRDYQLLAGSPNTEVVHKESGCRFKLDPQKVYFSTREGTERERIVKLVSKEELVMVFFAGVGPFAISITKHTGAKTIGIEINPKAIKYFQENIKLNKIKNIEIVEGDVAEKATNWYGKCDRVLMPLPEDSDQYLEQAIKCLKKGGICHYYCFASQQELEKEKKRIKKVAEQLEKQVKILDTHQVLQWGSQIFKQRIDFNLF